MIPQPPPITQEQLQRRLMMLPGEIAQAEADVLATEQVRDQANHEVALARVHRNELVNELASLCALVTWETAGVEVGG